MLTEGELSFIFIAGEVEPALPEAVPRRATSAPRDLRRHASNSSTPAPSDVAEAEAILAAVGFDLLYARLDAVRIDGRLAVMELELIEPMLYLGLAPGSAERPASAVLQLSEPRV